MSWNRLVAPALALSILAACTPAGTGPGPDPQAAALIAGATPTPTAGGSATPTPVPAPPGAIRLRAELPGVRFSGAAFTVRRAVDLVPLLTDQQLGPQGRTTLADVVALVPGTVVVVQVRSDTATLNGLFLVPGSGAEGEWILDLATTVVARKVAPKLGELFRSSAELAAAQRAHETLVTRVRGILAAASDEDPIGYARGRAERLGTVEAIEGLANELVRSEALQGAVRDAVGAWNQAIVDAMVAGGPVVAAGLWQVCEVRVEAPTLRVVGPGQVEVGYNGRTSVITVANAQDLVDAAVAAREAYERDPARPAIASGLVSGCGLETPAPTPTPAPTATPTPPPSSGGGGSGSSEREPSLKGIVSVGGVAKAGALVQLIDGTGAIVDRQISAADGSYGFYEVAAGEYVLVVAVDGAVQSSTTVTIP